MASAPRVPFHYRPPYLGTTPGATPPLGLPNTKDGPELNAPGPADPQGRKLTLGDRFRDPTMADIMGLAQADTTRRWPGDRNTP